MLSCRNYGYYNVIARSPALNKTESGYQSYLVQEDAAISTKNIEIAAIKGIEIASPRFRGGRNDTSLLKA